MVSIIDYCEELELSAKRKAAPSQRGLTDYCSLAPDHSIFPVIVAIFNSPMAFVIWISRGQAMVQLKIV
ncbi:MAG: hypothetical protein BroJett001_02300 [Chloroflexota bacterium]|nr:MAG: hypothetical protein BroJett001_02300 [Chloroflexota bacterium]